MLLTEDIFKRIDEIVERSYVDFTYDIIGDKFLTDDQKIELEALGLLVGKRPLIELVYQLVRQRSEKRYHDDRTLKQLLQSIVDTGVLPTLPDTQQATIDNSKKSFDEVITSTQDFIKKKINDEIIKINKEEREYQVINGLPSLPQQEQRNKQMMSKLLGSIAILLPMFHSHFAKGFTSELTDFVNNTIVDEVSQQEKPTEAIVYKLVNKDKSLCQWCSSFYTNDDGTPKMYKLSELIKNGSNIGKPKSAWKPVVGATHYNCRCQLIYLNKND